VIWIKGKNNSKRVYSIFIYEFKVYKNGKEYEVWNILITEINK
jgi:hypothetical protein